MTQNQPILIVEDDLDDQEVLTEIFTELNVPHQLLFFTVCADALKYLKSSSVKPFLIICDINLPGLNGLEFKQKIDEDKELRKKSIPFVFLSTAASKLIVDEAFGTTASQGFFEKSSDMDKIKETISAILAYWRLSKHPSPQ